MAYVAVLDADVLHPYISVDLLLRLAERRLFRPAWTEEILREVRESLIKSLIGIYHGRVKYPEQRTA